MPNVRLRRPLLFKYPHYTSSTVSSVYSGLTTADLLLETCAIKKKRIVFVFTLITEDKCYHFRMWENSKIIKNKYRLLIK